MSFPIQIIPGSETADCRCTDGACPFHEVASGHTEVLRSLGHVAEHTLATGHQVNEHIVRDAVVLSTT